MNQTTSVMGISFIKHIYNHNIYLYIYTLCNKLIHICFLLQYKLGERAGRAMWTADKSECTNIWINKSQAVFTNIHGGLLNFKLMTNSLIVYTKFVKLMVRKWNIFIIIIIIYLLLFMKKTRALKSHASVLWTCWYSVYWIGF